MIYSYLDIIIYNDILNNYKREQNIYIDMIYIIYIIIDI